MGDMNLDDLQVGDEIVNGDQILTIVDCKGTLIGRLWHLEMDDAYGQPVIQTYSDSQMKLILDRNQEPIDPIDRPSHYMLPGGIEVIDITKHMTFCRGNIVKYVLRADKSGQELKDLKKARKYLQWEIERVEGIVDAEIREK